MSVYYNVIENLTMRGGKEPKHVVSNLQYRFSVLGALLLQGEAKVFDCSIKTENGEWSFSGKGVCSEMQAIAEQLAQAKDVDFCVDYEFVWSGGNDLSHAAGPFELMQYICPTEVAAETAADGEEDAWEDDEPELPVEGSGFLYSCWHVADCADDESGILFAYGEKDGKQYRGVIEAERVAAEEIEGDWYSPSVDIDLNDVYGDKPDAEALAWCETVKSFHQAPEGTEQETFDGQVRVAFRRAEEMKAYFEAVSRIVKNVEYAPFAGIYYDMSGEQMRMLQVDLFSEEQPLFLITQL